MDIDDLCNYIENSEPKPLPDKKAAPNLRKNSGNSAGGSSKDEVGKKFKRRKKADTAGTDKTAKSASNAKMDKLRQDKQFCEKF